MNFMAEEKNEEKTEEKPERLSKNLTEILGKIEKLTVLELASLVKAIEEKFGISATVPVAQVPTPTGAILGEEQEEKSIYDVILASAGENKITVIKAVRELRSDLGLKDAKELVDSTPKPVMENVKKEEAEEAKKKLEEAGATVELK